MTQTLQFVFLALYLGNSPGFKEKDSANLEPSVKICIRGQFFVLNKIRRGARLIF